METSTSEVRLLSATAIAEDRESILTAIDEIWTAHDEFINTEYDKLVAAMDEE
jgi:hypothetical protein